MFIKVVLERTKNLPILCQRDYKERNKNEYMDLRAEDRLDTRVLEGTEKTNNELYELPNGGYRKKSWPEYIRAMYFSTTENRSQETGIAINYMVTGVVGGLLVGALEGALLQTPMRELIEYGVPQDWVPLAAGMLLSGSETTQSIIRDPNKEDNAFLKMMITTMSFLPLYEAAHYFFM